MSKNAIALIDCNNRDTLLQFIIDYIDRKAVKNEMVSPYDDQLIGKMNFRYDGIDYAMFFTFARSSEYPGMKFRNHKVIYASLGVSSVCSEIFMMICQQFGGFVNHDDDLDIGFQKVERLKANSENRLVRLPVELPAAEIQPIDMNSNTLGAAEQTTMNQEVSEDVVRNEKRETAEYMQKEYEESIAGESNAEEEHQGTISIEKGNGASFDEKSTSERNSRNKRRRDKQRSSKENDVLMGMKKTQEAVETAPDTAVEASAEGSSVQ